MQQIRSRYRSGQLRPESMFDGTQYFELQHGDIETHSNDKGQNTLTTPDIPASAYVDRGKQAFQHVEPQTLPNKLSTADALLASVDH